MLLIDALRAATFAKLVLEVVESVDQVPHVGAAGDILSVACGKFLCFGHG